MRTLIRWLKRQRRLLKPQKFHSIDTAIPVAKVTVEAIYGDTVTLLSESLDGRPSMTGTFTEGDALYLQWHFSTVVEAEG